MERLRGNMNGEVQPDEVHPLQQRVARFQEGLGAESKHVLAKYKEELIESLLEHGNSEYSPEFAEELTDVVITALGLIHCMGLDFGELFDNKMALNERKYASVPTLRALGQSYEIATGRAKELWNEAQKQGGS